MRKWVYSVVLHTAIFCILFFLPFFNLKHNKPENQLNLTATFEYPIAIEMQSVKDITFESIETNPHIELHIQPSPEDLLIYQLPAPQKISCLPSVYLRGPCSVKKWHKRLPASKNNIRPPVALKGNPLPVYPYLARINNYEGLVILKVSVSPEGRCVNVTVVKSSGYKILDKAAVEAVEKWRFVPSQKNGKPVYGEKEIKIRFKLI